MAINLAKLRALASPALTLLVLLLAFGVFYFVYVSARFDYFTQRNFSLLGELSHQLSFQIEIYRDVLERAARKEGGEDGNEAQSITKAVQGAIELIPALKPAPVPEGNNEHVIVREVKGEKPKAPFTLELRQEKGESWLALIYEGPTSREDYAAVISVKTAFRDLLEPFVSREVFDDVFVAAKDDGYVVFQRNEIGLSNVVFDVAAAGGKKEGQKTEPDGSKVTSQSIRVLELTLAGAEYKLFLKSFRLPWPIRLPNSEKATTDLVVGGLVRAQRFQSESLAISYTVLLIFIFVVVMTLLAWPFLKLLSMGPAERVNTFDVVFLAFSALIGSVLLTFFLLDVYAYQGLAAQRDRQLKEFAEAIVANVEAELEKVYDQLHAFNQSVELSDDRKDGKRTAILTNGPIPTSYPYLELAFWAEPKAGKQKAKWTVRTRLTPMISVKERDYFKRVTEDRLWSKTIHGRTLRFYLESIISWTTGEAHAILSIPYDGPDKAKQGYVSAIETSLLSLIHPMIPPSVGYAVIASDGKVLFHSDETRNLREHLFKETDNNPELRSAVYGRRAAWMDVSYLGTGHRLYVKPVAELPWSLVVYENKQALRTVNLELLSVSLILFVVYFVLMLGAHWLAGLAVRRFGSDGRGLTVCLWPDPEKTGVYYRIAVLNSLLGLVFVLLSFKSDATLRAMAWLVLPTGLLHGVIALRVGSGQSRLAGLPGQDQRKSMVFRSAYRLAVFSHLVLVGVLPAVVFFMSGYDYETGLLIKHGQLKLARALEQRVERVERNYRSLVPEGAQKHFLEKRLSLTGSSEHERLWDLYLSNFWGTDVSEGAGCPSAPPRTAFEHNVYELLKEIRLPYNNISVETQGLSGDGSDDRSWRWSAASPFRLCFEKSGYREERHLSLTTMMPSFGWPDHWYSWIGSFLAVSLVFGLVWTLVGTIARRVFLLGLEEPAIWMRMGRLPERITVNMVLIGLPFSGKSALFNRDDIAVIDLRIIAQGERWADEFPFETALQGGSAVAIDHFEHGIGDVQKSRETLRFMELLALRGRPILIVSSLDPWNCFVDQGAKKPWGRASDPLEPQDAARWEDVLSNFSKVYIGGDGDQEAFGTTLSEAEKRMQHSKLLRMLKNECSPTAYLQTIGTQLAAHTGFAQLTPEQLIQQIRDRARPYYRRIWLACSNAEKVALLDVAKDGFANVANHAVQDLLMKGLLARDPGLRCMNDTFRQFVLAGSVSEDIGREAEDSNWRKLRIPLLLVLMGVGVFLFSTQAELFKTAFGYISALTAAVPALIKLLDVLQPDKTARKDGA